MSTDLNGRRTTVYRIYCSHGSLLYVGVAVDVERRLRQHAATKAWWPDAQVILTDVYGSRIQALKVEACYIIHFRPKHNVMGQAHLPKLPHPVLTDSMYVSVNGRIISETDALVRLANNADGDT